MKDKQYIVFLEETILDLFDEIKDLSKDYEFSIDGGDCNFNYILSEYQKAYYKYYKVNKPDISLSRSHNIRFAEIEKEKEKNNEI
jgi:hypothetical protein|tara:strand:+ start:1282 stop:1536 length:255 start_codon:yes stop_codon:yes gene_type:complete